MAQVIIGVDAGTTVIKSVAFSLSGEELRKSSVENVVDRPESGWAEQSMVTTWKKTAQTLSGVEDQLDDDDKILALGVTGRGNGYWLVDEGGDPIRPAILWSDGRTSSIVQVWQQSGVSEQVYDICGGTQFPGSSLVIPRQFKENEPERYKEADTVFYCKDWLKYKLTDELTTDLSDASLPYVESEFAECSGEVLDVVGMLEVGEMRPDLVPSTDVVGGLTRNAAVETGLPRGTPAVSSFIDITASAFGSGAANPGDGSSIVGTTSVNQTVLDEAPDDDEQTGIPLALGVEGGLWIKFMSSMTGTPNLDWVIEEIMDKSSFNLVEEKVESIPVGSGDLIYHPFLSSVSERASFLNSNARAQFMGLNQEHTQAHLVHIVYEGISFIMRDCFTHPPQNADEVYLSGGGANSDFWCQMFAGCLNTTIIISEGAEFGAKGAVLLAGVGTGAYDDLPSATATTSSVAQSFEPQPKKVQQYSRWCDVYTDTYEAMLAIWDERVEVLEDLRYMSRSAGARPNKKTVVGKDTVKGGYDG